MLSNMKVFSDYAVGSMTETIDQQVKAFNEASNGTITLVNKNNAGDFAQEAMFAAIPGLVRRRNAYGTGAVTAVNLTQLQNNTVKVAGGTPPIAWEPQQFSWIQQNQKQAGVVIGEQLAKGQLQDMLNTALMALVAACTQNTAVKYSATGAVINLGVLNKGAGKFGDRADSIAAWAIHSKAMTDMRDAAITNGTSLFTFGTINIKEDGFGRRFIVTDSPALYVPGTPDTYNSVGMVPGAALVEDNGDFFDNINILNGQENIQATYQAEWTYNLGLKGYTWDTTNGGKSPNATTLGTSTNWDKTATSNKDTAAVLVVTQ